MDPAKALGLLLFQDGFGDRVLIRDTHGRPLHVSLLLRAELSSVPSFEFALNQRIDALERFDDASFVRVRRLVHLAGPPPRLSLIADYSAGTRLTEVLAAMEQGGARRTPDAPLFLIKEILDAVAVLHRQSSDVSHGALAPERILISDGQVRITDYAMGSAVEQLRFSAERYWKDLRVAVPASAGASRFDRRLDVAQVGMIALALLAGRELRDSEHMGNLGEVLAGLSLAPPLRTWLLRTLHMDPRRTFVSAVEARHGLEGAMSEAGVRPSARELDIVRLRARRVNTTVAVRTAQETPAPSAVVNKPIARAPKSLDPWNAHDVSPDRLSTSQGATGTVAAAKGRSRGRIWPVFKYVVLAVLIGAAFAAARYVPAPSSLFSRTGMLVIESKPQGVELLVDGQPQGVTPVTLKVEAGRHEVELRGGGKPHVFNVYVSSGARISQYVELRSWTSRIRTLKPGS